MPDGWHTCARTVTLCGIDVKGEGLVASTVTRFSAFFGSFSILYSYDR